MRASERKWVGGPGKNLAFTLSEMEIFGSILGQETLLDLTVLKGLLWRRD